MKTRASKYVAVPAPTADVTHIKVTVLYDKGGMNYANYKIDPRGYYLSVGPVALESGLHFTAERFRAFSAAGFVLEETKRLSGKRLGELVTKYFAKADELAAAFLSGNRDLLVAAVRS